MECKEPIQVKSLATVVWELAWYKLDLVRLQEVR
jgi:hypothetical protein